MDQAVFESVTYSEACQDCGAELECRGVQALVDGCPQWDAAAACAVFGFAVAVYDEDLPGEQRNQMLAEHGPPRLRVISPSASSVVIMRVLRAELGTDLVDAKALARRARSSERGGTLPEMELLVRKLRASGVAAAADRPQAPQPQRPSAHAQLGPDSSMSVSGRRADLSPGFITPGQGVLCALLSVGHA
ncbi:hypothetical protein OIA45_45510 (plasmid) [Streptomyces chartreusis]|uniref:hypothetical protein n=1 Tax=Streptomyces chartreusis TaxID=1969 RepID=UPI002F90B600|nr:hypothetical protein OIA45_45510 [Streptomyces chartreusis]